MSLLKVSLVFFRYSSMALVFFLLVQGVWSKDVYVREVVCQFSHDDVKIDFNSPYFRFDVDENENVYFLDQTNLIKVFNSKGQKTGRIVWTRDENKFFEILTRGGDIFIYSGYDGYTCHMDGSGGRILKFKKYLEEITLMNHQIYSYQEGNIVFSLDGKNTPVPLPFFNDKYVFVKVFMMGLKDGSKQTLPVYDGYYFLGIETFGKDGELFANYGKPTYPDADHQSAAYETYTLRMYEFDKNLDVENVWDIKNARVNETTGNVYEIEATDNHDFQLVRLRKKLK